MKLEIGNVKLNNPFIFAPLAGISDAPFRRICSNMGAGLVYSEMISAKGLYYNDKSTEKLLTILPGEGKVSYQLFGSEPSLMADMAEKLNDRENVFIDINMGCPVPKIVKNGEGSALLKSVDKIYDIVYAMKKKSIKPVTAKIRMGFDDNSLNYLDVSKAIFSAGGDAVCMHGRTREAFYSGKADWSKIRDLKEKFPDNIIIGNGDITDAKSAFKMFDETGCDLVMIGRGALGNPWLFKELNLAFNVVKYAKEGFTLKYIEALKNGEISPINLTVSDRKEMLLKQLNDTAEFKGEYQAVREIRKHVGWYFKGVKGAAKLRGEINQIDNINELRERIKWL